MKAAYARRAIAVLIAANLSQLREIGKQLAKEEGHNWKEQTWNRALKHARLNNDRSMPNNLSDQQTRNRRVL